MQLMYCKQLGKQIAADVITRMYNVTSKQVLTHVSKTQALQTKIRGERKHEKLFSSPSMTTTLRNKIKIQRGSLEINGIMKDVLQYQKPAMKKSGLFS